MEMKDENKEEEKETVAVIEKRKDEKEKELKRQDEQLYRPHGLGLDTGNY